MARHMPVDNLGTLYKKDTDDMFTITRGELNHFLKMEIVLQALMEAGIHTWEGYDGAMEAANAILEENE